MKTTTFSRAAAIAAVFALALSPLAVQGAFITVPNGDFNDNSDGDILAVDLWSDNDNQGADEVQQVDNAVGKAAGDLVMIVGFKFDFANPTVATGVNFDSSKTYTLSLDARSFNDIDLTDASGAYEDNWGFVLRDMTNGNNIKTKKEPNPLFGDNGWVNLSFFLTSAELLQYELDEGVDVDTAEIGIRIFKNGGTADFVAIDNVTLEVIPEPATMVLAAFGLVFTAVSRRRA